MSNAVKFLEMYADVNEGNVIKPRGSLVKEVEDYVLTLDMRDSPCTSFHARKFNLEYAKAEVVWYLGGNRFDRSIETKSNMWPKIIQPDGSFFSNYGQYIFGEGQFYWVVEELVRDKDSRRASIVLLKNSHMFADNKDMVCTYSINFRIRNGRLNMSVNMRSNDAVYGTTNDVFSFSIIYQMVLAWLRFNKYPELLSGTYSHKVDSLHIYERHWEMVKNILAEGIKGYYASPIASINCTEDLLFLLSMPHHYDRPPPGLAMSTWLFDRDE